MHYVCVYRHAYSNSRFLGAAGDDSIEVDGKLSKNTTAAFEWRMECEGVDERRRADVRCDNACERGVPFPAAWRYTAAHMAEAATKAARRAERPDGVRITCRSIVHTLFVCITRASITCAYIDMRILT